MTELTEACGLWDGHHRPTAPYSRKGALTSGVGRLSFIQLPRISQALTQYALCYRVTI